MYLFFRAVHGVVALHIQDDDVLCFVDRCQDASCCPGARKFLQDVEVGAEDLVEQSALSAVLNANDGNREILFVDSPQDAGDRLDGVSTKVRAKVLEVSLVIDELLMHSPFRVH